MREKNIANSEESGFRFNDIYWLCKDPTFFNEGIKILLDKGIYDPTFLSYSIFHKNEALIREYLSNKIFKLKKILGPEFSSSLIYVTNEDE